MSLATDAEILPRRVAVQELNSSYPVLAIVT